MEVEKGKPPYKTGQIFGTPAKNLGCAEHPDTWKMQFFAGQKIVVIPDADKPGMDGGKWARRTSPSPTIYPLFHLKTILNPNSFPLCM